VHGIEHILLGVDHLLFVLALTLIVRGGWALVKTITAFTVAHSITLALATFGVVHVPGPPVEAGIALSILLLAVEIVRLSRGQASITAQRPWAVAFCFGLLHGLGFASALTSIGLPQQDVPLALLAFNVGVEIGQLAFVSVVLTLRALARAGPAPCSAGHDPCDRDAGCFLVLRAGGEFRKVSPPRFGTRIRGGSRTEHTLLGASL
jgi:hydrogenase/urease accessory protein HupE